jgi:hypothetical protein
MARRADGCGGISDVQSDKRVVVSQYWTSKEKWAPVEDSKTKCPKWG